MSLVFWGLTSAMIIAAVSIVVTPISVRGATMNLRTVAMAVVVSIFAIGLSSVTGSPDAVTAENDHAKDSRNSTGSSSNAKSSTSVGSVASMVDGLKERLNKEPDDANGWILLARSYEHLGRNEEAVSAYNRAKALRKSDSKLEESLVAASRAEYKPVVRAGPTVRGRIVLSPDAAALVEPSDTVFIFAKGDMNQAMPLVALRKSVADLPLDYALTDDLAMMPGSSLADFNEVVVIAQVSRSGRAKDVYYHVRPIFEVLFCETNPIPLKTALALRGLATDELRLPLTPMTQPAKERLQVAMKEYGLL